MFVKNTLNTLNTIPGTDIMFEPGEIKCIDSKLKILVKTREGLECISEPETQPEPQNDASEEFKCEVCGKVCKSKLGLISHLRTHK